MKNLLLLILLLPVAAFASNPARFDLPVLTTTPAQTPVGSLPTLLAVTNATIAVCGYPATLVNGMCTNTITTYTDSTLTTACPSTAQLTAPGTSVCISTTGLQGTFGFWFNAATQTHMTYTVQSTWGTFGPYDIDPGSVSGGGNGTVTGFTSGNLSPLFTTSVANGSTTPAQSFTASTFGAHTFYGNNGTSTTTPGANLIGASDWSPNAYVAGSGSAQAQTVTLSPAATALTPGLEVWWLPVAANTATAPTLNVNGLGARLLTKLGTTGLAVGDLTTSAIADAIYDGSRWQLQNPQTAASSFPSGTTNQMLYYPSSGATVSPLTLGTNLSITGGTLNATSSSGSLPAATGPGQGPISSAAGTTYTAQQVIVGVSLANYNASNLPITYGTTTSGSNSVAVVDASSWVTGEGVYIPGTADSSGGIPVGGLYCDNVTVSGNTLTMLNSDGSACNATSPSGTFAVPVIHFNTTHGAITTGTNALTVASAVTFASGQGIRVAGAGASGADLICPVVSVSGTAFTLFQSDGTTACNASTTVTTARVFHDDTLALKNALAAGNYIRVPGGAYYLSSEVDITNGQNIYGDGPLQSIFVSDQNAIDTLVVKTSGVTLKDFGIFQSPDYTPTSGVLLSYCDGSSSCITDKLLRLYLYGGWDQLEVQARAIQGSVSDSTFYVPVHTAMHYSNAAPWGDINFDSDEIDGCSASTHCTTATGLLIDAADTNQWSNLKINSMGYQLVINGSVGGVYNERFINLSSEGGENAASSDEISIVKGGSNVVGNIQFNGGELRTNDASGVILMGIGNGVTGFQMTGAQIVCDAGAATSGDHGLDIAGQNATISGNTINQCGDAVRLESTAQNVSVVGNSILSNAGWGIDAIGSPAPNYQTNNNFSNNTAGNQNVPAYQAVDNFAGAASLALTSHYADTGQSWTAYTLDGDTGTLALVGNGQVQANTGTADAYSSLTPSSPNYTVTANCTISNSSGICAVMGRISSGAATLYEAIYIGGAGFDLYKLVAGTATEIGSYSTTFTVGTAYTIGLVMNGTSISATINGTQVIAPVTDTDIAGPGYAGFKMGIVYATMGNFRVANNSGLVTQAATQEYVQDVASNDLPLTGGTLTGNAAVAALAPATSSTTVSSPGISWTGNYWNGTASASDTWTCTNTFNIAAGFTNPPSVLTCTHSGSSGGGTFQVGNFLATNINAPTVGIYSGNLNLDDATPATSGSNYPSSKLNWQDSYWTGSTFTNSGYALQLVDGTGANPTQTLLLTRGNAGSGAQLIDFSAEPITLSTATVNKLYFGSGGPEILTGSGAPSGTYPLGSIYIDISSGTLSVYAAGAWHTITTS